MKIGKSIYGWEFQIPSTIKLCHIHDTYLYIEINCLSLSVEDTLFKLYIRCILSYVEAHV